MSGIVLKVGFDILSTIALIFGFSLIGAKIIPNRKRYVLFLLCATLLMVLIRYILMDVLWSYAGTLMYAITVLMYAAIFRESIIQSVISFIVALMMLVLIEMILISMLGFFGITPESAEQLGWPRMIASSAEIVLLIVIKRYVPLKKTIKPIARYFPVFAYIFINLFLFLTLIKVTIDLQMTGRENHQFSLFVMSIAVAVINILIIISFVRENRKTKRLERYNELKQAVQPLIDRSIRIQHDFKNHLNVIKTYMGEDNTSGLKAIDNINENMRAQSEYLKWNNPIFGALIQRKMSEANEKGIVFQAVPFGVDQLFPLEDYQLASIMMNLLDNAFDAVMELPQENRKVTLEMGMDDMVYLSVVNTGRIDSEVISKMFNKGFSTKGTGRGMGLHAVKNLVNQYNGEIEVSPSQNQTEIRVMFDTKTEKQNAS